MGQTASKTDPMASQMVKMPSPALSAPAQSTGDDAASKPKPCCVCKDEKSRRDECMLYSNSKDPAAEDCKTMVQQYRVCMEGYGFKV